MAYFCQDSLRKFIKTGKDKIDNVFRSNVVYKLKCLECDATYIEQTKRQLKTRIKEHRSNINRAASPSVISIHRLNLNYEFDWENVEILNEESKSCKSDWCRRCFILKNKERV